MRWFSKVVPAPRPAWRVEVLVGYEGRCEVAVVPRAVADPIWFKSDEYMKVAHISPSSPTFESDLATAVSEAESKVAMLMTVAA